MRIDSRFGSDDIMKAKIVIQEISCRIGGTAVADDAHIAAISAEVDRLREKTETAPQFIQLLSFLDFLETIAYFANEELISMDDIQELLGTETVVYYYRIFKDSLICSQRKYLNVSNNIDYSHLDVLVKRIMKNHPRGNF